MKSNILPEKQKPRNTNNFQSQKCEINPANNLFHDLLAKNRLKLTKLEQVFLKSIH